MRDVTRYSEMNLLDYAKKFTEETLCLQQLPQGFFEYWLQDGRALILLDGLDEVAEEAKRCNVVQQIDSFLNQYHQNIAIITSRPAGYRRDFFRTDEFLHYQLEAFDQEKIEAFINNWYDSRVADPAEAERRKKSLRKAFDENDRIKLLARNPLLLTIITLIHRYQVILPKKRYQLYDKAVETLLKSWDANKELTNHRTLEYLKPDDLRYLMEQLAYWVHTQGNAEEQEGGTLIDQDELIQQLSREIKTLKQIKPHEAKEEAKRFIDFIRERTGLLNEQGQDCYAFVHKTFQEYLCAKKIKEQADNEDEFKIVIDEINNHLHDSHWREVLLLLIAQHKSKKAAKAIQAILNHKSEYEQWLHRDLLFAGYCLTENPERLRLNAAQSCLVKQILERLVALEVKGEEQIGGKVHQQVFKILCSLSETDFETQALHLLKEQSSQIDEHRLFQYQVELGDSEAVIETLVKRLSDENSFVRLGAAVTLGQLRNSSQQVVDTLVEPLSDQNSDVRLMAAVALTQLRNSSQQVVDVLLEHLLDYNSDVRWGAANALVKLGKKSDTILPTMIEWLEQHPDSESIGNGIDVLWDLVAEK